MLSSTSGNYINLTLTIFFGVTSLVLGIIALPTARSDIPSTTLLFGLLAVGLAVAALHGVSWTLIDKAFGWEFGSGGGAALPSGYEAAILSMTITIPLVVVPYIAQFIMRAFIDPSSNFVHIPSRHYLAILPVIIASIAGHLVLYGIPSIHFSGIRNSISPLGVNPGRLAAILMEVIYAVIHFSTIALVYLMVIHSELVPDLHVGTKVLKFAIIWLLFMMAYILLFYPWSAAHPRWIDYRGVIGGLALIVCLTCVMYSESVSTTASG